MEPMHFDPRTSVNVAVSQVYSMAELVKKAVTMSIHALLESNTARAQHVINDDTLINSYEIEIDNTIYNTLAIVQLPADLLRRMLPVQKISIMLERIGDHAVNIAESALSLAIKTEKVLHDSLESFFKNDIVLAQNVLTRDEEVDSLNISITQNVKERVLRETLPFEVAMELIRVCKNCERIADLASNIAEEASFSIAGKIVKHKAG
jgi:phosphate transport system protein